MASCNGDVRFGYAEVICQSQNHALVGFTIEGFDANKDRELTLAIRFNQRPFAAARFDMNDDFNCISH